jgi:hypothetical protein
LGLQNNDGYTPLILLVGIDCKTEEEKTKRNELLRNMLDAIPEEKRREVLNKRSKSGETFYSLLKDDDKELIEIAKEKANKYRVIKDVEKVKKALLEQTKDITDKASRLDEYSVADEKKKKLAEIQKDADILDKDLKEARNKLGEEIRSKRLEEFFKSGKISSRDIVKLKDIQQTLDAAIKDTKVSINSEFKNKGLSQKRY